MIAGWWIRRAAAALGVTVVVLTSGCRREPDPPPPVSRSEQADAGNLMRLVHADDTAWVRVDVARLRTHPVPAGWHMRWAEAVGSAGSALDAVVLAAEELLWVSPDPLLARQMWVLRGAGWDREAVLDEIRSGIRSGGVPMQATLVSDARVWRDPANGRALAMPASNLVMSGPDADVRLGVLRQRTVPDRPHAWTTVVEGHVQWGAWHRSWGCVRLPAALQAPCLTWQGARLRVREDAGVWQVELDLQVETEGQTGALQDGLVSVIQGWARGAGAPGSWVLDGVRVGTVTRPAPAVRLAATLDAAAWAWLDAQVQGMWRDGAPWQRGLVLPVGAVAPDRGVH